MEEKHSAEGDYVVLKKVKAYFLSVLFCLDAKRTKKIKIIQRRFSQSSAFRNRGICYGCMPVVLRTTHFRLLHPDYRWLNYQAYDYTSFWGANSIIARKSSSFINSKFDKERFLTLPQPGFLPTPPEAFFKPPTWFGEQPEQRALCKTQIQPSFWVARKWSGRELSAFGERNQEKGIKKFAWSRYILLSATLQSKNSRWRLTNN